ncbi:hypothetical protein VN97_g7400 [Penicillium thymicola]|uniref:Uncharacterized protein n=1 Tax=Penicillium thymicola TaxID=293382 RepID=A0AAI9TF27_PENTH|nr:hypothetical protein VN97_g7400 [Penicillium thymicola]
MLADSYRSIFGTWPHLWYILSCYYRYFLRSQAQAQRHRAHSSHNSSSGRTVKAVGFGVTIRVAKVCRILGFY